MKRMNGGRMDFGHGVLNRQALQQLLAAEPPLLEDMPDPAEQIQPNGIDITLAGVQTFASPGTIGVNNAQRVLPDTVELPFDADGLIHLTPGPYIVQFGEKVNLPTNVMAYARPRSSLLRSGVALHTAVWDAGYSGRGSSLLVVYNTAGFTVAKGARICQLVFHTLTDAADEGYSGIYHGEGSERPTGSG